MRLTRRIVRLRLGHRQIDYIFHAPTSPSERASHPLQLEQLWIDLLIGLFEDIDEILGLFGVVHREERVRRATVGGTCRPSDSVDIVLGAVWVVEVDDVLDVFDVYMRKISHVHTAFFKA